MSDLVTWTKIQPSHPGHGTYRSTNFPEQLACFWPPQPPHRVDAVFCPGPNDGSLVVDGLPNPATQTATSIPEFESDWSRIRTGRALLLFHLFLGPCSPDGVARGLADVSPATRLQQHGHDDDCLAGDNAVARRIEYKIAIYNSLYQPFV